MKVWLRVFWISFICLGLSAQNRQPLTISLSDAIDKSLIYSTRLKSSALTIKATTGNLSQAGSRPNPELSIDFDNFLGSGNYRLANSAELTYGLSQIIELGAKRSRRITVAQQELATSQLSQEAQKLDVIRDTTLAYANAIAAQELLKLASEQKLLAEELSKEVGSRVVAAREPLIQRSKAEIAVFTARFAFERAERELSFAKHALANQWNDHDDRFILNDEYFFQVEAPIIENDTEARLPKNPDLKLVLANQAQTIAQYELEKANAYIDPRINFGLRHHLENNDFALIAGLSFALPFFNRNQGHIERSRFEVLKVESDIQTVHTNLIQSLHEWLKNEQNAFRNMENLKTSILPAAKQSFNLSRKGYLAGKMPYLEVLDSQRTLFQVKEQFINSLRDYHHAKAEMERLTAQHSDRLPRNEDSANVE